MFANYYFLQQLLQKILQQFPELQKINVSLYPLQHSLCIVKKTSVVVGISFLTVLKQLFSNVHIFFNEKLSTSAIESI